MHLIYIIKLLYRLAVASLVGFGIVLIVTGMGASFGQALGLTEGHNAGEVVTAFMAGALVTLVYRDRLDVESDKKGETNGE